jgi:hypothetical protein
MGGIVTAWMELAGKMILRGFPEGISADRLQIRRQIEIWGPSRSWIPAFAGMTVVQQHSSISGGAFHATLRRHVR